MSEKQKTGIMIIITVLLFTIVYQQQRINMLSAKLNQEVSHLRLDVDDLDSRLFTAEMSIDLMESELSELDSRIQSLSFDSVHLYQPYSYYSGNPYYATLP